MPWMRLITQVSRHQPELRQFKSLLVNSFSPVSKFGLQGNGLLNAQRRFQSSYPSSLGSRVRDTDEASEVAYLKELNYQNDPKKEKVQRLLDRAYNNAKTILTTHSRELHALANALLEEETLSGSQIKYLLAQVNSQQQQQTQHQQVIVTTQSGSQSILVPPSTANQTGATVAVSTTPAKSTAIAPVGS